MLAAAYLHVTIRTLERDDPALGDAADPDLHLAPLLAQVRVGDHAAFKSLALAVIRPLELYARRFTGSVDTARDVVQDVLAHLWEHRQAIQVRGSVRGYLYTAVRNRALNLRRRDTTENDYLTIVARPDASHNISEAPDVTLIRRETAARVAAALAVLPPRAREAALLRWQDGLSRAEIASVMGVALGTVKNHLTTATIALRALLADLSGSD
jgi:RNA polymerase sigma-70 factor (ECF subfamily)